MILVLLLEAIPLIYVKAITVFQHLLFFAPTSIVLLLKAKKMVNCSTVQSFISDVNAWYIGGGNQCAQGHPCWKRVGSGLIVREHIHHPWEGQQSQRRLPLHGKILKNQPQPERRDICLVVLLFKWQQRCVIRTVERQSKEGASCLPEEGTIPCSSGQQWNVFKIFKATCNQFIHTQTFLLKSISTEVCVIWLKSTSIYFSLS